MNFYSIIFKINYNQEKYLIKLRIKFNKNMMKIIKNTKLETKQLPQKNKLNKKRPKIQKIKLNNNLKSKDQLLLRIKDNRSLKQSKKIMKLKKLLLQTK